LNQKPFIVRDETVAERSRRIWLSLPNILFIGFTLISAVPVLLLGAWVQESALEKEVEAVKEKHLLVARNLTGALTRYVTDVEAGFRAATDHIGVGMNEKSMLSLLNGLHIRALWTIDGNGSAREFQNTRGVSEPGRITPAIIDGLAGSLAQARKDPASVVFSNLIRDGLGGPSVFLIKARTNGDATVGILGMDYVIEVQQTISFGDRGHAAIVDRTGHVMAHPVPDWRTSMKDIGFLPPVKHMMAGETGVSQFYTPAMQADMVAGFTTVPRVGWGVMIPQPFQELEERAGDVRRVAMLITLLGIFVAGLISLWLVRSLSGVATSWQGGAITVYFV